MYTSTAFFIIPSILSNMIRLVTQYLLTELLPRGKASFSLLSAMELGTELPERKEPGLEIAPGINFIPWQLSE